VVFLIGIEENLLPHENLGQDISEERRLFYVGITRAEKKLILSRANQRRRYGKMAKVAPSRFILDLPEDLFTTYELGYRPLQEDQKKTMLSDLFSKLDNQSQTLSVDK
jgi:DNA helicase-2/ATP-dependent DNA helicase PcrA